MSQVSQLVSTLKKTLRRNGLTYADVAETLGLSESTVKRMFSRESLSLARMEQICGLLRLDFVDLVELTRAAEERISELSEAQEKELVSNERLMLVGLLAINHWSAADMLESYMLSEAELTRLLARLDRVGIIELLPQNRIKVKLSRNFRWREDGPIQRFFERRVQQQFFRSSFLGRNELRVMVHGAVSEKSLALLQQRMKRLAEEFDSLIEEDRVLERRSPAGTTQVLAIRPWEMAEFAALRRPRTGAQREIATRFAAGGPNPVRGTRPEAVPAVRPGANERPPQ
ncbi:MAG: helix-turn-helix transcriptional regulator [Burkholderiales bacterium]|nr:helix-turn-helix transcriptional regulator [Burkholderiales bacterium]